VDLLNFYAEGKSNYMVHLEPKMMSFNFHQMPLRINAIKNPDTWTYSKNAIRKKY
jgi:hypothetical protein